MDRISTTRELLRSPRTARKRNGASPRSGSAPVLRVDLSNTSRCPDATCHSQSLLTTLFFTSGGFFLRTRSALTVSFRAGCSLGTRGRLRMSGSRRTWNARGTSLRPRCSLLMGCRLRTGCLVLVRASCSRFILGRLVLVRAGCSRFILGGLVLVRASCSRFILGCLVLIRARRSRFIFGGLILVRARRSCFILDGLVLVRARLNRFILSGLILVRARRSRFIFGALVLVRARCSRFIFGGLVLVLARCSCFILGCLVRCSRLPGCYHSMTAKLRRLGSCRDCRPPVVHGRQERVVSAGSVHMLGLRGRCRSGKRS